MIVKFFNTGRGTAKDAFNYLLGKNNDRANAKVIKGDSKQATSLIDTLSYKQKYTSGVLAFKETKQALLAKNPNIINDIINEFEETIYKGVIERPQMVFIEHTDKGNLELHFIIPNIADRRSFTPFLARLDTHLIDSWQNKVNLENDLHDPKNPANKQALQLPKNLPAGKKAKQEFLNNYFENLHSFCEENEMIFNRKLIENEIKKMGLSIHRNGENYISIRGFGDLKGSIKLSGEYYERGYNNRTENKKQRATEIQEFRENANDLLRKANQKYQTELQQRERRIREKHERTHRNIQAEYQKNGLEISNNNGLSYTADNQDIIRNLREVKARISDIKKPIYKINYKSKKHTPATAEPVFYKSKNIGFIDEKPNSITAYGFKSMNAAALNLVLKAKDKGMKNIVISGNKEFQKHAIKYAIDNNLSIKPNNKFQEELIKKYEEDKRRTEQQFKEKAGTNDEFREVRTVRKANENANSKVKRTNQSGAEKRLKRAVRDTKTIAETARTTSERLGNIARKIEQSSSEIDEARNRRKELSSRIDRVIKRLRKLKDNRRINSFNDSLEAIKNAIKNKYEIE